MALGPARRSVVTRAIKQDDRATAGQSSDGRDGGVDVGEVPPTCNILYHVGQPPRVLLLQVPLQNRGYGHWPEVPPQRVRIRLRL